MRISLKTILSQCLSVAASIVSAAEQNRMVDEMMLLKATIKLALRGQKVGGLGTADVGTPGNSSNMYISVIAGGIVGGIDPCLLVCNLALYISNKEKLNGEPSLGRGAI